MIRTVLNSQIEIANRIPCWHIRWHLINKWLFIRWIRICSSFYISTLIEFAALLKEGRLLPPVFPVLRRRPLIRIDNSSELGIKILLAAMQNFGMVQ